jgi:Ca2+-binding RTX toxin-like protein
MAKPSVTNIRPPVAPPVTDFSLGWGNADPFFALNVNSQAVIDAALLEGKTLPPTNNAYDSLVAKIDPQFWTDWGLDSKDFDYIFLGANSKDDLTVEAGSFSALGGIIATGNGKDVIHAGTGDDLVLAGNGKDDVHGGAGMDSLFGENGNDTLFGDADDDYLDGGNGDDRLAGGTDNGDFSLIVGSLALLEGVDPFTGALGENPGSGGMSGPPANQVYNDHSETLHKQGVYIDSDHVYEVFNFSPQDYPVEKVEDVQTFCAVLYGHGFAGPAEFLTDITVTESKSWNFAVDLTDHADGGMVVIFKGSFAELDALQLADPVHEGIKQQAFDALADVSTSGESSFAFTAGDVLTGGDGADAFYYAKGDGVDEVTDYHRGEGDKIQLHDVLAADVDILQIGDDSYIAFKDGGGGYLADAAIKITGVTDFNVSEIEFVA